MNEQTNEPLVTGQIVDSVLHVEFHRQDKKNALTQQMYRELIDIFTEAERNSQVRVILLKGSQGCFTAGNDIGDFLQMDSLAEDSPVITFLQLMAGCSKPIVAAVAGPAVGIGTTALLHCDLVVAADNTHFSMPFINLALCPEFASSLLVPRQVGHVRAAELLMLGNPFSTKQALAMGLINRASSEENYWQDAEQIALELAAKPPAALRATKALLKSRDAQLVEKTINQEAAQFGELLRGAEAKEAFTAFMEKRTPDFSQFD